MLMLIAKYDLFLTCFIHLPDSQDKGIHIQYQRTTTTSDLTTIIDLTISIVSSRYIIYLPI